VYLLFKGVNAYARHVIPFRDVAGPVILLAWLLASVTVSARMLRLLKPCVRNWRHWLMLLGLAAGFAAPSALLMRMETLPSVAIVAVAFCLFLGAVFIVPQRRRRDRMVLVGSGLAAAMVFAVLHVWSSSDQAPAVWPLVLGGAAFFYLWWLAILVFDLSFIWHRYIRHAVAQDKLVEWAPGKQARKVARRKARLGTAVDPELQQLA